MITARPSRSGQRKDKELGKKMYIKIYKICYNLNGCIYIIKRNKRKKKYE